MRDHEAVNFQTLGCTILADAVSLVRDARGVGYDGSRKDSAKSIRHTQADDTWRQA
jgi:hypothetical protein